MLPSRLSAVLLVGLLGASLSCDKGTFEPVTVASVEVNGGGGSLRLGQTRQLTPILKSAEGWTLPAQGVSWSTSNVGVASVTGSGQLSAVARGTATLTASAGGVSGTTSVSIIGVQSVSLTPETLTVIVTQTRPMTATTVLDAGVTVTPTWRSLDTTIAKVDTAGRVTAKSTTGFARIEVTAEDKKDTAVVRVVPVPVVSVVVTPDTATREPGQTVQLTATPKDSIGGTLTGRTVLWTSSDASKATVSSGGLVTGVAVGIVTITATIEGKTASSAVRIQESPGIRARLRGPAGTGFFFVRLTGTNNAIDSWHRLVAQNDTALLNVAQDAGANYAVRVYAVDARTNNLQQGGGWVRVIGVWKRASLSVEPNARTEISVTVPSVTIAAVQAADSVNAFTSVPVTWQVADSTGMIREMANHHLSYGDQPFGDGTIGPGRRDATQVVNGQGVVTFSSSIPAQEVDGVRYWRMVHWQEVGGTVGPLILSLPFPSVTNGEPLRQLQIKPVPQGVRLSLRGPVGTGSFFVNILGSGLPQGGIWRRINNVSGDTATLQQMLPVGSNYQVRLFAVDAQTDPERTGGGWVALTAVGRVAAATVLGNAFTAATIAAQPVAVTNIVVPDSATVGTPVPLSWEINDTTGIIHSFANKHIGYDEAPWGDGQIGPGRVDATATLVAANRYRYSASIPAQQSPKLLAWKISLFEEVGALFGVNRLSIVAPSITWRAEAPRFVTISLVASVKVSPAQLYMTPGSTYQLTALVKDGFGSTLTNQPVSWSSSDTTVVTVTSAGIVTAKIAGTAVIRASSDGKFGETTVTVAVPQVKTGTLAASETWSGIINVTGSVRVPQGLELTILPGTRVLVDEGLNIQFLVEGKLFAVGTASNKIVFQGSLGGSAASRWDGIKFRNTQVSRADSTGWVTGSKLVNVSVLNATTGVYVFNQGIFIDSALFTNNGNGIELRKTDGVFIRNSDFISNTYGIFTEYETFSGDITGPLTNAWVYDSRFLNNGTGILIGPNQRSVTNFNFRRNRFQQNYSGLLFGQGGYGINGGSGTILSNDFVDNGTALSLDHYDGGSGWSLTVADNTFARSYRAVVLEGVRGVTDIKENFFYRNRQTILTTSQNQSFTIRNNSFVRDSLIFDFADQYSPSPEITANLIDSTFFSILDLRGGLNTMTFSNNVVVNTRESPSSNYWFRNRSSKALTFSSNFIEWGDLGQAARVFDGNDDFNVGVMSFASPLPNRAASTSTRSSSQYAGYLVRIGPLSP